MNIQESIRRILKEEVTLPLRVRRYLSRLDEYFEHYYNTVQKHQSRYKPKYLQDFIDNFINELIELYYQGWLSNDIEYDTDEFNMVSEYIREYNIG